MIFFSHAWTLKNDVDRLQDILKRVNVMPLGSGALAGNPFNIDRNALASSLGFEDVTQNSMQSVSDRDFVGNCIENILRFFNDGLNFSRIFILVVSGRNSYEPLS